MVFIIIPVFAYEVYTPSGYTYKESGDKLLFVVDYSNSMSEFLEHKTKVNQVREMMNYILPQISPETKVGLRVYGHTCNLLAYNACRSSELVVPMGINNDRSILSEMKRLRPRGMTPITYSLKQAVNKDLQGEKNTKHIILLTDGGENCDESPCTFMTKNLRYHPNLKIDVIAYDIRNSNDISQLECVALVTRGRFYTANTAAELADSLTDSLNIQKDVEGKVLFP